MQRANLEDLFLTFICLILNLQGCKRVIKIIDLTLNLINYYFYRIYKKIENPSGFIIYLF